MQIQFEFDTDNYDLQAVSLARLMLDIQHLAIVTFAIAEPRLGPSDIVFDPYKQKYKWLIEAQQEELSGAVLSVISIRMESPLRIAFRLNKLGKGTIEAFRKTFRYIINHLLFLDLERERRSVEIQMMREQVLEQRIKTVSSALDLVQKIPDEELRDTFLDSLRSSVFPFAVEHPPIKEVKLIDDNDDGDSHNDEEIIDGGDDESKPN